MMLEGFLSSKDVAGRVGLTHSRIRQLLAEEGHPEFPNAVKVANVWLVPEADVADYLRRHGHGPRKPGPRAEDGDTEQAA